ncbi:MAG: trimeric intracellular cation channel family protein [Alphaproteobacteria bacterium]|nr:trimeric intracellular cation channel family protein [Alphaproteobacteria bacterium]MBU1514872.1 trimeric intracellular cation channel family protein [Alphaproteobacteria bacterium]MBU2093793.1 trimeric intracellular cation channel family protein [Alphaproteobacteria bacterium]MBU2149414.1 trimeric intracellular cation channel family protein [Alphaproteobacteria bacterium]MBU2305374.1 trimeric intracellular cation channel family protein [Alphaproteobacteria bacterium]
MDALTSTLTVLDYAAVAVFGASGALAAARGRHDIVTFGFFAAVTGVGGGTLRDLLIGAPVFWVGRPEYIIVCLVGAVAIWVMGWGRERERMLLWLDALGMAAYAVVGALKATSLGIPPFSAVIMGVLTSTFGGVLRDVLAHEPSILLRRELYVTPALVGAAVFVGLHSFDLPLVVSGAMGFLAAFTVRAGAILFGWQMPGFPGRSPPT